MFSSYIAWYLFLGGAGSGAYVIASIFNIVGRYSEKDHIREYREITRGGFYLGPALVGLGTVFLIFDLGVPEQAYRLFLTTKFTILSFGAWAILVFCALSVLHLFIKSNNGIFVPLVAMRALELLTLTAACCVMTYTGVFIASMPPVPFLNTPLVVALFIASSLSCGSALITLYGFLNQQKKSMLFGLRVIPRIDTLLIIAETGLLAALFAQGLLGSDITRRSVGVLVSGSSMLLFWLGLVAAGIIVPLTISFFNRHDTQITLLAISALSILTGGIVLRYCILAAGLHVALG